MLRAHKLPASNKPEPLIARALGLHEGRGTAGLSLFLVVGSREFPWEGAVAGSPGVCEPFFSSQIEPGHISPFRLRLALLSG